MTALTQRITPRLLGLDAGSLLAEFGAGNAVPGSGSAAALNGALACELIATSAKLTFSRTPQPARRQECEYVLASIGARRPVLQDLVQRDNDVFAEVIQARRARDQSKDAKARRRHGDRARRKLHAATELAVRIANECVAVAKLGLIMVDIGYAAAKGDPASGVSNAIAGSLSAILIAMLNIKKCRGAKAQKLYAELQASFNEMTNIQTTLLQTVAGVQQEIDRSMSKQLRLF